jgi:triacylglycerol lipase
MPDPIDIGTLLQRAWPLALGACFLVATVWFLRRRPWRGPRTRYPVVLAHGLMGFDELGVGSMKQDYFKGVAEHLVALGLEVYTPRVPALASVEKRAEVLASRVRALPGKRVNIVAHSMGGLDARFAVAKLGLTDKVASVVTIGTPHRGTPLADLGIGLLKKTVRVARLWSAAGGALDAFMDLSSDHLTRFNAEVKDARGVFYGSAIAAVPEDCEAVHGFLAPSCKYLAARHGPNDGLVPATSQRWGKVLARVEADHWAQIGWSAGLDAPAFYESLMRKLRARGL